MQNAGVRVPRSQVHPSQIDEFVSDKPARFVRRGTTLILLVIVSVLALSSLIRYPDVLEGTAILTTDPLPVQLYVTGNARLMKLHVESNGGVKQGAPILEFENPTGLNAILVLGRFVDSVFSALTRNDVSTLKKLSQIEYGNLGEGQRIFNSLSDAINAFVLQSESDIYSFRRKNLLDQGEQFQKISAVNNVEGQLSSEELNDARLQFLSTEKLYQDKVISRKEYHEELSKLRQKRLLTESQKRGGLQHNAVISENEKALLNLQYESLEKTQLQTWRIREQVRELQNFIQDWKLKFLLLAPYSGVVHFSHPLQQYEQLHADENLGALIPDRFHYIASLQIPAKGAGKLHPGQEAQIFLDQFPVDEFGYLTGRVKEVSVLSNATEKGNFYRVDISMPDSLLTSFKHRIPFSGSMSGRARVITKDRNLLERLASGLTGKMQ